MKKLKISGLMLAALFVAGCADKGGSDSAPPETAAPEPAAQTEESHAEAHSHGTGPNGGVVFDLGKYHAEFTVDHPKHECTILFLGADEKSPGPVAAKELTLSIKETKTAEGKVVPPMTVKMTPQDEADGKASKFVGTDPGIGNVADFAGTVLGEIDGKPSQGEFQE
ncbi:hypothetical protein [Gimesia panareensis]|uniref:Uncharacterized protein n=1 Tax=Gimesia panareensis TaxID=2527978 RepID=A0A517QEP0_9PLAN|nr:hypothetical protein [Gimesia panareensis]QDT30007.1 hypothetical protein Enr10x_53660 [Gimesia panareensis]QDU53089.1 hypothetical protein Pan110_54730 [Gimesia panareensis]